MRLLLSAALVLCTVVSASAYPDDPINVILPWSPGGAADTNVRSFTEAMSEILGTPMPVRNPVGAAGTIGTTELIRSKADGYTIGNVSVGPLTTQPHLRNLQYDLDSFEYICLHYSNPQFFVVANDAPFSNSSELADYLEQNPSAAKFGSPGIGTIPHVAGLALGKELGLPLQHIPFTSDSEMLVSTLGGDIIGWVTQSTYIKANEDKVHPLAVMSQERLPDFPDVPTFREQGLDLVFDVWGGLAAPKGVDPEIIDTLEDACEKAVHSGSYAEIRSRLGMTEAFMGSEEFEAYVRKESERNAQLLQDAGVAE